MPMSSSSDNWDRRQGSYYNKLASSSVEVINYQIDENGEFVLDNSGNKIEVSRTNWYNIPTGRVMVQDTLNTDWYYNYDGATFEHQTHYHVPENYAASKVRMVAPSEHTIDGESFALEL